mgnify:CR=1 FL=1|uniref:Uncharacterized protein n=1 Tax=Aegilops tauschii subsp. strangulata TaxID=200361 RepID=A0A453MZZ9_AEGTS
MIQISDYASKLNTQKYGPMDSVHVFHVTQPYFYLHAIHSHVVHGPVNSFCYYYFASSIIAAICTYYSDRLYKYIFTYCYPLCINMINA